MPKSSPISIHIGVETQPQEDERTLEYYAVIGSKSPLAYIDSLDSIDSQVRKDDSIDVFLSKFLFLFFVFLLPFVMLAYLLLYYIYNKLYYWYPI